MRHDGAGAGAAGQQDGDAPGGHDEAHLAALLAVLALMRADAAREAAAAQSTPLQQWRARRLAALSAHQPKL
jgi:hypothetical protein